MHIAFAASECVPFSKTGGLADVVGALPRALAALGHQVSVYVPRYRQTKLSDAQTVVRSITVPFDDRYRFCSVVSAGTEAVPVDRKSTRLNSSHVKISYAVFCLKKKKQTKSQLHVRKHSIGIATRDALCSIN